MQLFSATFLVESSVPNTMVRIAREPRSTEIVISRERLTERCGVKRDTITIRPGDVYEHAVDVASGWIDGVPGDRGTVERVKAILRTIFLCD